MKLPSRSAALLIAAVLFLCLPAVGQKNDQAASPAAKKSTPMTRADGDAAANALKFPTVEGWAGTEKRPIPSPGDGYTVGYNYPGYGAVTVYVYSHRMDKIPDELAGVIKDELEGAAGAIRQVASMGVYSDVKEGKTETIVLGGAQGKVKVLRTQFALTRGEQKMNSEIYVFPYKNNIVKLRVTRSASASDEMNDSFANLLAALDGVFIQ